MLLIKFQWVMYEATPPPPLLEAMAVTTIVLADGCMFALSANQALEQHGSCFMWVNLISALPG